MRKNFTKVLAMLMVLVMALAFTGCGKEKTLESWYADNAEEFKEVEDTLNASTTDCTIKLTVEGNTLIYRYEYTEAIDVSDAAVKEQIVSAFDTYFDAYESTFTSLGEQISEESKVKDVTVRIDVFNPDGTEIYTKEFAN